MMWWDWTVIGLAVGVIVVFGVWIIRRSVDRDD